jgi:hypothetical protein
MTETSSDGPETAAAEVQVAATTPVRKTKAIPFRKRLFGKSWSGMATRKQKLRAEAAGTPLNPVAKSATKKTSKVRKTSRGK